MHNENTQTKKQPEKDANHFEVVVIPILIFNSYA